MNRKNRFLKLVSVSKLKNSCILLLCVILHLFFGFTVLGYETAFQLVDLKIIRAGRHANYSSVVFEFDNPFQFDKPVAQDDEVHLRLNDVKTTLPKYRKYKNSESWVKLKKVENDLNVRIGLLKNFLRFTYSVLKDPDRLVINLYWDESPIALISEKEVTDPEDDIEPITTVVSKPLSTKTPEVQELVPIKTQQPKKNVKSTQANSFESTNKRQADIDRSSKKKKLLTLNFYQGDIREILSGLAMQQQINIVTSKDVSGKVSVHLYKVPFKRALDAICQAGGFSYHKQGNIYYVFRPKRTIEPLASKLKMRVFKIEYADLDKIQEVLSAIPGIRMIKIHEPSKTIIVEDTPENIEKVETLIRVWDVQPKQVMIEAQILEVVLTDDMSLGVNWEQLLGDARIGTGGFSRAIPPSAGSSTSPVPSEGEGIFSNIIIGAGTRYQFTAALDALRAKTKINTLSTPKILAIHGKPAMVQVGGKQGYVVTTVNQGISTESVQFIDTGTILEITPYIDHENNIFLEVRPSLNSAELQQGIPVVRTTNVATWMVAKNGETVFIGGLIQDTGIETQSSVPCLGDIPGLSFLFGRFSKSADKSELIVLITPQILEYGAPKGQVNQEKIDKIKEKEEYFKSKSSSPSTLLDMFPSKKND
jgi:type IV pilus secretin PilQ/predicted competence protein